MFFCFFFFFFFKQKTAYEMSIGDWSSDVCSSDLCMKTARSVLSRSSSDAKALGKSRRAYGISRRRPFGIKVPKRGLEPPLPNGNQLLKLARLPNGHAALTGQ